MEKVQNWQDSKIKTQRIERQIKGQEDRKEGEREKDISSGTEIEGQNKRGVDREKEKKQ